MRDARTQNGKGPVNSLHAQASVDTTRASAAGSGTASLGVILFWVAPWKERALAN